MIRKHMNKVRGIKGSKPRVSGNGDRSAADEQYLLSRNRQISAKAQLAELELRARLREWIPVRQVEADLSYILVALRQRVLNIHRAWPRKLMGKDLHSTTEELRLLEVSLLDELRDVGSDSARLAFSKSVKSVVNKTMIRESSTANESEDEGQREAWTLRTIRLLSAEDAWLLRLDLDALTDREVAEIRRYYRALKLPAPRDLEAKREAIRRVRDCEDIVHGFDDERDFSWWKSAFKFLKPPEDSTQAD